MRPEYTPRAATLLAIVLVAAVSACGDKNSQQAGAAPAREIQLAPNAPAQPQLNDTAVGANAASVSKTVAARKRCASQKRLH